MNRETPETRTGVEAIMLLAMSEHHSGGFEEAKRIIKAQLAAIEAAGVRLVPAKCTDDMAGYAGARAEARGDIRMLPGEYRAAWEAMLAASPYAPLGG